jgi:beta-glucosidase-like glycosyl hydrolase
MKPTPNASPDDGTPAVHAVGLRALHRSDALGIGNALPRLSWRTETERLDWRQQRYELQWLSAGHTSCSDVISSNESAFVEWPFAPLQSRQQGTLRVRVWGEDCSASEWSEALSIEAGLLEVGDWSARFITPAWDQDTSSSQPGPLLRREFMVQPGLTQARLYITACGCYEAAINGQRVGDEVLAPGWTSYHHRLRVQTHDVTGLLREGGNALGALLGDGWFASRLGLGTGKRNQWGERLALLAQLELQYADGRTERVVTDASWRAATGGLRGTDIYDGETWDARLEPAGWQQAGFDASQWSGVRLLDRQLDTLVAPEGPPMRRIELIKPVQVRTSPSGKTIIDFGQNLVGWLRIRVDGPRGRCVTLRHAEVLQDGELCTAPLRTAQATDRYICAGAGVQIWEPRFTFHGFQYVEVSGWPGDLAAGDIEAVVVHSDMQRSGWFTCSDPLVTRLHENAVWGMRGNFLDVPTDCPQRDERLGWTGDLQVFTPTAAFLYDCHGMLGSWLQCLAAEQRARGVVPFVVPDCSGVPSAPTAAWGDVAAVTPWVLYQRSGDRGALARQYPSMKAWVDQVAGIVGEAGLWNKGYQFGDWLDPTAPRDNPAAAKTHPHVLATAHLVRSARCLAQTAQVLGLAEDDRHFTALAGRVRQAFLDRYVTPDGVILGDSITSYSMALVFELLEGRQRDGAATRLKELVAESGYRIATGFVGTPLVCDALVLAGGLDHAYKLLLQRECPSWLYPVSQGATTIWERWDSIKPDGRVNDSGMTSFNHYAFGAVADWLHRCVAGLSPIEPGYRRLRVQPQPGGGLTHAEARHLTPYGLAAVSWQVEGRELIVRATVAPNTRAEVVLPGRDLLEVGSGQHEWRLPFERSMADKPRLTVHNSAGELMADKEVWDLVKATMVRVMPALKEHFEHDAGQSGQLGTPLAESLALVPAEFKMIDAVTEALDAHYAARERGETTALPKADAGADVEPGAALTGSTALVARLTPEEKAALCSGASVWTTQAVERLGIPSIRMSDGPHGLRRQPANGDHLGLYQSEPATCYPSAAGLASSWNVELIERVGSALALEALAADVQVLLGPGINIKRSPLCGRNFEYFSEDPKLTALLGAAWVRAVQAHGVGASLKHFAVNNQETDRMRVDAQVDERALREIYLAAFEHIVRETQPWTVMGAYNKVNGQHACANAWLLTQVLRGEWGFQGLVVSDWGAVSELPSCITAGTDLEMPSSQGAGPGSVLQALQIGTMDEAALDRAVTKLLELVECSQAARGSVRNIDLDAHHALARKAAAESAVMLKNEGDLLPLDANASLRVAVIGEFARTPRYQGEGSSRVNPSLLDNALDALRTGAGASMTIEFAPGFGLQGDANHAALRDEAVALAGRSDVVLLFLGLPDQDESEGFDRTHIELPAAQRELLAAVATVQPAIAVLLSNGAVVQTSGWDMNARAILELWLGGQAGGGAVADLVYGQANPSGKLAETIPLRIEDTPAFLNFPGHAGVVRYGEGLYVGYRGYDKRRQAVGYPFGHGLSYTRFEYSELRLEVHGSGQQAAVGAQATIRNVGNRAGQEVVQLYVGDPQASTDRPLRELKGFAKLTLAPGEAREVHFTLSPRDLSYYSVELGRWVLEGGEFEITLGASSRDLRLSGSVSIDAPMPAAAISAGNTILEWLTHPKGGTILQALVAQAPGDPQALLRMIEGMPLSKLVAVSGGALTQAMVDQMVAAANA